MNARVAQDTQQGLAAAFTPCNANAYNSSSVGRLTSPPPALQRRALEAQRRIRARPPAIPC